MFEWIVNHPYQAAAAYCVASVVVSLIWGQMCALNNNTGDEG